MQRSDARIKPFERRRKLGAGRRSASCRVPIVARLLVVLTCALLAACGLPSNERIEAVRLHLEQARERGADQYLPELFAATEERIDHLELEMEKQAARGSWSWGSGAVRGLLSTAEAEVAELNASTDRAVLEAQEKAEAALEEARAAVDRAAAAYWGAPRGKDTRAEILRMRSDLETIEGELEAVRLTLEQGEFLLARNSAEDITRRAGLLSRTIDQAMAHRLSLLQTSGVRSGAPAPTALASPARGRETPPLRASRR